MELNSSISAIVTGGASGLGLATARRLAREGVRVAIIDLNEAAGQAAAADIGGIFCRADVSSDEQVDAALATARHHHGIERILVNCAGMGKPGKVASRDRTTGATAHIDLAVAARIIEINLLGTLRCLAKCASAMLTLPALADGERGAIINTASIAAEDGQIGQAAYSASKGGIVGLTLPAARDLSAEGIRVNTILPGIFDTPLLRGAPQQVKDSLAAAIPFPKRLGMADEYASLALEILRNTYLNGATIRIDGAIRMAPR